MLHVSLSSSPPSRRASRQATETVRIFKRFASDPTLPGFVDKHELITEDERLWAPQAFKEVELWIGTTIETASARHLSYFVTERESGLTLSRSLALLTVAYLHRQPVHERWL